MNDFFVGQKLTQPVKGPC